jgi:hypothetical protein
MFITHTLPYALADRVHVYPPICVSDVQILEDRFHASEVVIAYPQVRLWVPNTQDGKTIHFASTFGLTVCCENGHDSY